MRGVLVAVTLLLLGSVLCGSSSASNGTLRFVVLGDWGGKETSPYYTTGERNVAKQMGKRAAEIGSQFTVALGDNFYSNGVKNVDDPRFQETFEKVFTAQSLQSRWYVICGNHDHDGNASAEVAYTARSKRWYMPDFYYTEVVQIPGTTSTVQFVFIDTILLAGLTDSLERSLPPKGPVSTTLANQQWAWINETLKNSKADWIIVAGHYPVWSISKHGPTQILVEQLRPVLMKYNVSAYFCGHDHNLQYIQESDSPVSYFVSGAGHDIDSSEAHLNDIPSGSLKFHYNPFDIFTSKGGFTTVSVTPTLMNVTFYDYDGYNLYSVSRPKIRNS